WKLLRARKVPSSSCLTTSSPSSATKLRLQSCAAAGIWLDISSPAARKRELTLVDAQRVGRLDILQPTGAGMDLKPQFEQSGRFGDHHDVERLLEARLRIEPDQQIAR